MLPLNSDSKQTLAALLDAVPQHNIKRHDRSEEMWEHRAAMDKVFRELEPQYSYVKALRAALPENGLFVDEVSQMGFASRFIMPVYNPKSFISTGYQGTLGFGFGTALGVKVANPDKPVLSISGDGGFMYNVQELSDNGAAQHQFGRRCLCRRRIWQRAPHAAGQLRRQADRVRLAQSKLRQARQIVWHPRHASQITEEVAQGD